MEDFSFVSTICCLSLIVISFYWLFRLDYYSRRMSFEQISGEKLAINIVDLNPSSNVASKLQKEIESLGFKVFKISSQNQQEFSCKTSRDARISRAETRTGLENNFEQIIEQIKAECQSSGLKLFAQIHLPPTIVFQDKPRDHLLENSRRCQLIDLIRLHHLPAIELLSASLQLLEQNNARIILVQDETLDSGLKFHANFCLTTSKCLANYLHERQYKISKNVYNLKIRAGSTTTNNKNNSTIDKFNIQFLKALKSLLVNENPQNVKLVI